MIIYDNAKCHIAKLIKKFVLDKKLKVLTNIPYYSIFNGIEYVFLNIKSKIYKMLLKNKKELKDQIKSILNGDKIKETIKKIYLSELNLYLKEIQEMKNLDFNQIYQNI